VDTVVGALDGTLGQVFLVTTPLPLQTFLGLLPGSLTGFVSAEVDQLLNLVGGLNAVTTAPGGLTDTDSGELFRDDGMEWLCKFSLRRESFTYRKPRLNLE